MNIYFTRAVKFVVVIAVLMVTCAAQSPTDRSSNGNQPQTPQEAKHWRLVRKALPPHSALPPLLDLTKPPGKAPRKDRAWEDQFDLAMGRKGINDPGVAGPNEATSIGTTHFDYVGVFALPARNSRAVVIARPAASAARISLNHRMVYAQYSLTISQVLKGDRNDFKFGATVIGVVLGASVLFPSGHLSTFIVAHSGFLQINKPYVLFLWKPHRSKSVYMISQAYLIRAGVVYPVNTNADVSAYENGLALKQFETKLKIAIAKNIDTD